MNLLTHLHPAIVHFPIALLLLGSAVALAHLYHLGGPNSRIDMRRTAWFLISLGWLATIPAILSGLLAQSSLLPDAPYRNVLNWHTATGIALLVFYGLLLYKAWIFQGAKARKARAARQRSAEQKDAGQETEVADLLDNPSSRLWLTVALFGGIALIIATGWNGGILVYEWGVNVLG
jgi:uncharacterized membrane protein